MKILIVEDEIQATLRLKSILNTIDKKISITGSVGSVKETINWLNSNDKPDLIFLDIQLSDGTCFEIFDKIKLLTPIIFITAFNQYAIDAFKVNSIDYILKPYSEKEIKKALNKFKNIYKSKNSIDYENLQRKLTELIQPNYKTRFFTRINRKVFTVFSKDILYFYFEDNATLLIDKNNKNFVINYSLENLENLIDPTVFFRINRKALININAITSINILSKSRIEVTLIDTKKEIVSRAKTPAFKNWLDY